MVKKQQKPRQTDVIADLWPGQSVDLLKALHIFTPRWRAERGSVAPQAQTGAASGKNLIRPALIASLAEKEQPVLADLGAGKSYLGFVLYDLFFRKDGRGIVYAVESRHDLIETSKRIASGSGASDRMRFVESAIRGDGRRLPDGKSRISSRLCTLATLQPTKPSCSRSATTRNS